MIYYHPTDGDVYSTSIKFRPKTCFLMTRLGQPIPAIVTEMQKNIVRLMSEKKFDVIDADSVTNGKDLLFKIWKLIISVPVGVAIIYEGIPPETMANIFYELGLMHAYGKETIIVKDGDVLIPSDLVRTEHIKYDDDFERHFLSYIDSLRENADHYVFLSEELENNPLISIDYLRRAFLLTGEKKYQDKAREIYESCGYKDRAKNSVESLLIRF